MADAVSGTGVHVRGACEAPYPPNNLLASASALRGAPSKAPLSGSEENFGCFSFYSTKFVQDLKLLWAPELKPSNTSTRTQNQSTANPLKFHSVCSRDERWI